MTLWVGIVLGLIDSLDINNSTFDEIMEGDIDDGIPELLHVSDMKVDKRKIRGALMFRDLRDPDQIIFDDRILDALKKVKPKDGLSWRVTIDFLD